MIIEQRQDDEPIESNDGNSLEEPSIFMDDADNGPLGLIKAEIERFGPQEVREKKNSEYAEALIKEYSEPVIRDLLKAICTRDTKSYRLICLENLANKDLTNAPLSELIRPHLFLGSTLRFARSLKMFTKSSSARVEVRWGMVEPFK